MTKNILDSLLEMLDEYIELEGFCRHSYNCEVYGYLPINKHIKNDILNLFKEKGYEEFVNKIKDEIMVNEL